MSYPYPPYNNQQPMGPGYPNPGPPNAGGAPYGGGVPYPPAHQQQQPQPPYQQPPYQQPPYQQPPYQQPPYQQPPYQQQPYPGGPVGGMPVFPPMPQPHPQPQYGQQAQYGGGGGYPSVPPQFGVPGASAGYPPYAQQAPPQQQQQQQPPLVAHHHQQQHHQQPPAAAATTPPHGTPTIRPVAPFNPVEDAKALRKAMKGFGTDEDGLIAVLCHRSNDQIQRISLDYRTSFGRDLLADVRSETGGNFEKLLKALLSPRLDFYAKELNDAMAGLGTNEDALVEILCSLSNHEIHAIKHHYRQVYCKDLESELMSETSGNFKRLLVSLCAGGRDESGRVDAAGAHQDAQDLLRAGEDRIGTDESAFNMVLCQRGYGQIRAICDEYHRLTGHSLVKAIKKEFSGDIGDGLVAVVECTSNKAEFFAKHLHKSMAGLGTDDAQLIRVIVMRAEVDLGDVKVAFERLYGKSLRSFIKGDTTGHYRNALYHLIDEVA